MSRLGKIAVGCVDQPTEKYSASLISGMSVRMRTHTKNVPLGDKETGRRGRRKKKSDGQLRGLNKGNQVSNTP